MSEISNIIEAILFAGGEPVEKETIERVTGASEDEIMNALDILKEKYTGGIRLIRLNTAYQLVTAAEMYDYVSAAQYMGKKQQLSQAAFEALTIIAYKQPVTRAIVEKIRGVNSDSAINKLIERGFIAENGRLDAPGRPILYVTTDEFLRSFGFSSLEELPKIE